MITIIIKKFLMNGGRMVRKKTMGGCAPGIAVGIVFIAALSFAVNYGEGADLSSSIQINNISHETGITYTQEVPFSKEPLKEIKQRESTVPSSAQRVIPFQRGPQPRELSGHGRSYQGMPLSAVSIVPLSPPLAPTLGSNFTGLSEIGMVIPPDTHGAVGPSHLMEILNSEVGFFTKSTGSLISKFSLQTFWSSLGTGAGEPANYPFDPKVIYDQYSGHFIAVTLGGISSPNSWLMLGISETSDPTGNWSQWAIDADKDGGVQTYNNWADYPGLGVDANYVYITANMFDASGTWQYSKVWVVNKTQLLNGSSNITVTEFRDPSGSGFTMQPAHVFGSSSAEYLIDEGYYISFSPPLLGKLNINSITFPGGTPTWSHSGYIQVTAYVYPPSDAPQSGSVNGIAMNDGRLLNAVFRNGYIWTTHTVSNNGNNKTEVAWYQIDPASASPSLPYGIPAQQGRISDINRWYYFPSIAVNSNGGMGIGFSGSSSSEYAGAYYTARNSSDASGTMQAVALLKSGLASYNQTRWGDYSATVVDPIDDRTFWTLQEYANSPASTWGTWWGKFVPASDIIAPSITSSSPSSPVTDTAGARRTFSITANQTVNVAWYINGSQVQYNSSVTSASYTNTSAAAGTWNVTAIANNTNGMAIKVWDWKVEDSIIDACTTISSPGNYVLNRSITASSGCIEVVSNDVVFNGSGHTIQGNLTVNSRGVWVFNGASNVTVKNLILTNWKNGILYDNNAVNGGIYNNTASMNSIGILLDYVNNNSIINNTATNNTLDGIYLSGSSNNTLTNNTANSNGFSGIYLLSSSQNNLTNITASNNTMWDFVSTAGSVNNNVANLSIPLSISFTGKDIALKSVSFPPADPSGYHNLSRFINATNTSADSWLLWNVSYDESEVTNLNESSLRIWRYNGVSWSLVSGTNSVDIAQNRIYANTTSFSIFAPMGAGDTTPPFVTNLSVTPSTPNLGKSVNITADASDINMNFTGVYVSVRHPGGYINTSQMLGNESYYFVYTNTSIEEGRYNVTVNASDVQGNFNNTQSTWFIVTTSFSANTSDNNTPIHIDALASTNTTLDIFENSGMAGSVNITKMKDIPPGINRSMSLTPFGKYISINPTQNIAGNLSWVKIRIFYSNTELSNSNLTESSLKIVGYNESAGVWEVLTTELNTTDTAGYRGSVEINVSHFSYYGIAGTPISTTPPAQPPCTSCGGGGGGGGGGGTSGENYSNVELKEKRDVYIFKDKVASYKFNTTDPIMYVNITGNISAGDVTTMVEVLRNTSSIVKNNPAPGIIYKNVNIWVGTSGFATPKNIQKGVIGFRVLNSWLEDEKLAAGDVRLVKWDGSRWIELDTYETTMGSEHVYYEAVSDSFSPFAITAFRSAPQRVEAIKTPATAQETRGDEIEVKRNETSGSNGILLVTAVVLVIIVAILATVYLREKKKI
jgi:PGF-pre-PGF domain-containing protein